MNTSITQANQNDKQISKSIKRFFTRFHISSALKASNAYKRKGIPVTEIFQYLFLLIFSNRSMYMSLLTGRNTPDFAKDTVYRFMKMVQINWMRFTTILASRIIKDAILPLDSEDRANVLIIDDSMFERNRSKKVELLAKVYDHAKHKYRFGFRMLTLGWSDGSTFLPVNSILLSTENKKNRINEAAEVDKRTVGYKRRKLSMEKGTHAMVLSLENRESNDNRSLGELFLYFSDEMSDITWIQAFQMLLQMFRTMLTENTELSDEKISELVDAFMNTLPALLKTQLQTA